MAHSPDSLPSRSELESKISEFLRKNTRYSSLADFANRHRNVMEERLLSFFRRTIGFNGSSLKELAGQAERWFNLPDSALPRGFKKQISDVGGTRGIVYSSENAGCSDPAPGVPGITEIDVYAPRGSSRPEKEVKISFFRNGYPFSPEPGIPQEIVISSKNGLLRYQSLLTEEKWAEVKKSCEEKTLEPLSATFPRNGSVSCCFANSNGYALAPDLPCYWFIRRRPWGAAVLSSCSFHKRDRFGYPIIHSAEYPALLEYDFFGRLERLEYYLDGLPASEAEWLSRSKGERAGKKEKTETEVPNAASAERSRPVSELDAKSEKRNFPKPGGIPQESFLPWGLGEKDEVRLVSDGGEKVDKIEKLRCAVENSRTSTASAVLNGKGLKVQQKGLLLKLQL